MDVPASGSPGGTTAQGGRRARPSPGGPAAPGAVAISLLGLLILAIGLLLVPLNWQTWTMVNERYDAARESDLAAAAGTEAPEEDPPTHDLLWFEVDPDLDTALIALVIVSACTGSYVHLATSFGTYVGNQRLRLSWMWWYFLRLSIGLALALVVYFAIRGGLLSVSGQAEEINPYGIAAMAGLVGLFSKQATDKLRETFDTLFATGHGYGDEERQDKAANPVPRIAGLEPAIATAGPTEDLALAVRGENFVEESVVRLGTQPLVTAFASSTRLDVTLPGSFLAQPGDLSLVVANPEPGGGQSEPVVLRVEGPGP